MFAPVNLGAPSEAIMDTPWGLTWNTAEDKKDVDARAAAKGFQGTDLVPGPRSGNLRMREPRVPTSPGYFSGRPKEIGNMAPSRRMALNGMCFVAHQ